MDDNSSHTSLDKLQQSFPPQPGPGSNSSSLPSDANDQDDAVSPSLDPHTKETEDKQTSPESSSDAVKLDTVVLSSVAEGGEVLPAVLEDSTVGPTRIANSGDYIVTDSNDTQYVISPEDFNAIYASDEHIEYEDKSEVIDDLYVSYLNGEHATVEFEGEDISSVEIGELGIDASYEKYLGYSKEDYRERVRLETELHRAEYALQEFELTNTAVNNVPKLIEDSEGLVKPDAENEWIEFLNNQARDSYHGEDTRVAIGLMKAHSKGTSTDDLKRMVDEQGYDDTFFSIVMATINHFYIDSDSLVASFK